MSNGSEVDGFGGAILADVSEARNAKRGSRVDSRMIDPKKKYPCPVCGVEFYLDRDIEAHITGTKLPDPRLRKGDAVVCIRNNRLSGTVANIESDHRTMSVKIDGSEDVRPCRIWVPESMTNDGFGPRYWVKRPS